VSASSPAGRNTDFEKKPAPLQKAPKSKRAIQSVETNSSAPRKKLDTAGVVKEAKNDFVPSGLPSVDSVPQMTPAGSRSRVQGGGPPSKQTGGGTSTIASLPSFPVREAIPVYRSNPPPEYPAVARRRGYEGTAVVEVLVSKEGRVQDFRLFRSSGYAVLDRAATAAIKHWLFESARAGDEKIEMWVKVPVRFQLK
jgi:TonB family protein